MYRRLHVLAEQYAESALAQPSRDNTHLGYFKDFKQIDRIKLVETGDTTRLLKVRHLAWLKTLNYSDVNTHLKALSSF